MLNTWQERSAMVRKKRQFPLVSDEELVIASPPKMELYDNEDLINNIHGDYHDKTYQETWLAPDQVAGQEYAKQRVEHQSPAQPQEKSYAELVREETKQDLKRRRQTQIAQESKIPSKPSFQRREPIAKDEETSQKPTAFFNGHKADARVKEELPTEMLSRLSQKLHQNSYILAELPKVYKEPNNPTSKKKVSNNYDFLKRSQIYNQQETHERRTQQVAKELNLMFDGDN